MKPLTDAWQVSCVRSLVAGALLAAGAGSVFLPGHPVRAADQAPQTDSRGSSAETASGGACDQTTQAAAKQVGVSEATIHRWLKLPAFTVAYREARTQAVGQAIARSQQMSVLAIHSLGRIMTDTGQPGSVRVTASKCILDFAIKGVEMEDLKARIEALEAAAQAEEGD